MGVDEIFATLRGLGNYWTKGTKRYKGSTDYIIWKCGRHFIALSTPSLYAH
jgi:hypothetical protein